MLLRNESAAIREATLDALIARAATVEAWHDPLVRRPHLSGRMARALSEMVATHLLEVLVGRGDLEPAIVKELRSRLDERLVSARARPQQPSAPQVNDLYAQARALAAKGRLTEGAMLAATRRGDDQACAAMLAVGADVPLAAIERAAQLRNSKAIVSLAWAAKLSMRTAVLLQTVLANIPPTGVLTPASNGEYPLAVDEMRWHIEVLRGGSEAAPTSQECASAA